ncbi:MAG TPA: tetratricopeptide repeat protein, partial [Steroidobacteraceae bacterium]|nr:tetratricopeptide repeat protein [Steroidobacteraceae bacterium]
QDLLLRAKAASRTADTEQAMHDTLDVIDGALALDSKYGDAMTAKATTLTRLGSTFAHGQEDWAAISREAELAAGRAVSLAPRSAAARVALGLIYFSTFRFVSALQQFSLIRTSSGTGAVELSSIAWCVGQFRRFGQALTLAEQAVALDPLNPQVHLSKANVLDWMRRLPEAQDSVSEAIRLSPGLMEAHGFHAYLFVEAGKLREAQQEVSVTAPTGAAQSLVLQALLAYRFGDRNRSNQIVDKILHSESATAFHYQLAEIYCQQGRQNDALAELERAWTARDPGLTEIQVDFLLEPLRSQPRFQAILKKLNFPA